MSCSKRSSVNTFVKNFLTSDKMILKTISIIKHTSKIKIQNEVKKLETITTIEKLLNEIDFSSEKVPMNDVDKLTKLLSLLKKGELNTHEIALVKEITNY